MTVFPADVAAWIRDQVLPPAGPTEPIQLDLFSALIAA